MQKKFKINYGAAVTVFPNSAVKLLPSASETETKVLIALLQDPGATAEQLSAAANGDALALAQALTFWANAGVVCVDDAEISARSTDDDADRTAKKATATHDEAKREKAHYGNVPSYDIGELTRVVDSNPDVKALIDECGRILGKMLNNTEITRLLSVMDYLSLSPEYVLVLCSHCATAGKKSMHYLETVAVKTFDAGITDADELEKHFLKIEEAKRVETQIRKMFGLDLSRALTTREKKFLDAWTVRFGYDADVIEIAYEITVDSTHEPSLAYANAILESWFSRDLHSADEIKAFISEEKEKKRASATGNVGKSFDSDDFFAAALKRSYGKAGIPPAVAEAQKKAAANKQGG